MSREEVLEILQKTGALLEGHFLLSSGRHSGRYVQCASVLRFPHYAEMVLRGVAEEVRGLDFDLLVGPAMGGIIVSYEMGRQLGKEAVFAERKGGKLQLRRGFKIKEGDRVLITEDVVTTGKSTLETRDLIEKLGGEVIGVSCIVDRTGGDLDPVIPLYSALKLTIKTYQEQDCPLCSKGIPLTKPGSRDTISITG